MYDGHYDGNASIVPTNNGFAALEDGRTLIHVGVERGINTNTTLNRLARVAENLPTGVSPVDLSGTGAIDVDLGTIQLAVDPATDAEQVCERLQSKDGVAYAERDVLFTPAIERREWMKLVGAGLAGATVGASATIHDTATCASELSYPRLADTDNYAAMYDQQYALQQEQVPKAWDEQHGKCGEGGKPTIAVIDSGVAKHPHLEPRVLRDKGWDTTRDTQDATPGDSLKMFHGTHVAGCAAGVLTIKTPIYSPSDANIIPVKVFGGLIGATPESVAKGIKHAADEGAEIANLSLGAPRQMETVSRAIEYADEKGTLPVVSTGNTGSHGVGYPARHPKSLAVGATRPDGAVTEFSTYGPAVNVVAPGYEVLSSIPEKFAEDLSEYLEVEGIYAWASGTSMAAPHAAGCIALALAPAKVKGYSNAELIASVEDTAQRIPEISDEKQGAGRIDAYELAKKL